jgi:hypothetical protein
MAEHSKELRDNDKDDRELETETAKIRFTRRNLKGRAKLCPRCLSPMRAANSLSGWMTPDEFFCERCGYRGHVSLENISQKKRD